MPAIQKTWSPGWLARYDRRALRPPQVPAAFDGGSPTMPQALAALRRWCFDGAGSGRSPLLRPRAMPAVDERFSVQHWLGGPDAAAVVATLACDLDGSFQLLAGGRLAGLWLRLRVKVADACWWRTRRASDPWDSGYAGADIAALARFEPRRATLVIAEGLAPDMVQAIHAALAPRAATFRHPVRLLIVGAVGIASG